MLGTESDTVLHELRDGGVLLLTLHRPGRNNAWNMELETALYTLFDQASASEDVRAIVLTGAGRSFCPGLDAEDLDRASQGGSLGPSGPGVTGSTGDRPRRPIQMPALVPKPVVCAINGGCAGLGLITALFSDVRFASADAKLTTAFARRGLPAEEAVSWILPRIVGHATALDLLLSGRVVTGAEAADLGLVHRALPADELLPAALAYAHDMANNCSPASMASAKRQVYRDWERSLVEGRTDARRLVLELREEPGGDFREGVVSFLERRPPVFTPLAASLDTLDREP